MTPTPPPLPAHGFVTVLGKVSVFLAVLGLAWALVQMGLALLMPDAAVARLAAQPEVPAPVVRAFELRHLLSLATLLLALLFLAVAWGLLKRREWARLGFIALLVAGAAANFAGLALIGPFFDGVMDLYPEQLLDTPDGQQFVAQMRWNRQATLASSLLGAVGFAVLHGWLAWKLCSAPVRAEFGCGRDRAGDP